MLVVPSKGVLINWLKSGSDDIFLVSADSKKIHPVASEELSHAVAVFSNRWLS